jgi:hypothetical protein
MCNVTSINVKVLSTRDAHAVWWKGVCLMSRVIENRMEMERGYRSG